MPERYLHEGDPYFCFCHKTTRLVAEKLKLQLKKLELIRLLSDQMIKGKRLGREIFLRGIKGKIRSIYTPAI